MKGDAHQLDLAIEEAWEAYGEERGEDALHAARRAVRIDKGNGRAWFVLGCVLERAGIYREADHAFLQARRAPDEPQPLPFRTAWRHLERATPCGATCGNAWARSRSSWPTTRAPNRSAGPTIPRS